MQTDRLSLYDNQDEYEEPRVLLVGKTSKRILAGLCDYFLIVFVGMIFYSLLVNAIIYGPLPAKANADMALVLAEQEKSGLVERNNDGNVKNEAQMIYTYAKKQAAYDGTSLPEDAFYRYYCTYEAEEGKDIWSVERFNDEILKVGQEGSFFVALPDEGGAPRVAKMNDEMRARLQTYVDAEKPEEIQDADIINAYQSLTDFYKTTHQVAWKEPHDEQAHLRVFRRLHEPRDHVLSGVDLHGPRLVFPLLRHLPLPRPRHSQKRQHDWEKAHEGSNRRCAMGVP